MPLMTVISRPEVLCLVSPLRRVVSLEQWLQGAAPERGREAQGRTSDGLHELRWPGNVRLSRISGATLVI